MKNGNGNGHNGNGHDPDPFASGGFEVPPDFDDPIEPQVPEEDAKTWSFTFFPTVSWWLERTLPPRDYLLGDLISTTTRMMLVGPTGRGKTSIALALSLAISLGHEFLHWHGRRPARVLYIDGEMAANAMQERLTEEVARQVAQTDNLMVMNREDFPDMPPLNTTEGQQFIDQFLQFIGPIDLMVFDNLQSLLVGDMRDTEQWSSMLPWVRELTHRKIGQLWVHHTNDDGKSYGDKSREWQLDTIAVMEGADSPQADISFNLSFSKARDRKPHNRADFEPALISLENNRWVSDRGRPRYSGKKRNLEDIALDALREAICEAGQTPQDHRVPEGTVCVEQDLWKRYFAKNYAGAGDENTIKRKFYEFVAKLQANQRIRVEKPWIWVVR